MACKPGECHSREKPRYEGNASEDNRYSRWVLQCGKCGKIHKRSGLGDLNALITWPGSKRKPS